LTAIYLTESNNQTIIKNNYLLAYDDNQILSGDNAITKITGTDETIENNTPNYTEIHILNTTTYNQLFEENTLKEEINGTIILTQTITEPIIINHPVNITSIKVPTSDVIIRDKNARWVTVSGRQYFDYPTILRLIPKYSNITFTSEANESNLTASYLNNLLLETNSINIQENTINEVFTINNSNTNQIQKNNIYGNIQILNSNSNIIEDNYINSKDNYTINIDETSTQNTIQNNTLTANILKGDLSIYNPQENTIVNNTPLNDVNIIIDCNDTIPILPTTIKINITCNNKTVNKGYVIVNLVNGTQILKKNITGGYLEFNYTPTSIGNQTLKVWYYGETPYNNTVTSKNITVRKSNITLTLESENITIGETININATVLDEYNNPIDNEILTFIVNNTQYNTTIHDGITTFTAKTNDTWLNGVQIKFPTTDKYTQATSNVIKPSKGEVIFNIRQKVEADNLKITAYLTDIGETPVANGYVRFMNGSTRINASKIEDGYASCEISLANVTNGAVILANFTNNAAFNLRAEEIILTLNPPTITQVQVDEVNGKVGQPTTITAMVTADDSTPVNEGTVTFTTTDYNETVTVTDGTATTTHTFTQRLTDTLKAIYTPANTDNYYESSNITTITITKDPEDTNINLEAVTGKINTEVTITATVTTTDGTPVD
ncbi:MAG: hypothetical protein BZ137_01395, partial [Methanosphaera sp. rholeuAM130]